MKGIIWIAIAFCIQSALLVALFFLSRHPLRIMLFFWCLFFSWYDLVILVLRIVKFRKI